MASPIPSPRAPASRMVLWIRSLVSRGRPRHASRINAPYGAELIPVASSTDSVSATVEAAAETSPQNTSTGVRALRASDSSLSVPVSHPLRTTGGRKRQASSIFVTLAVDVESGGPARASSGSVAALPLVRARVDQSRRPGGDGHHRCAPGVHRGDDLFGIDPLGDRSR